MRREGESIIVISTSVTFWNIIIAYNYFVCFPSQYNNYQNLTVYDEFTGLKTMCYMFQLTGLKTMHYMFQLIKYTLMNIIV